MNIFTKEPWETVGSAQTVEDYTRCTLDSGQNEGAVERANENIAKICDAFGRLLDYLATHPTVGLSPSALTTIVNGYPDEDAKFTAD